MNKKSKNVGIRDVLFKLVDIPEELFKNKCKITTLDCNKTIIEGYKSIIDFNSTYIGIRGVDLEIDITGKKLEIQEVSEIDLLIEGEIENISFRKVGV